MNRTAMKMIAKSRSVTETTVPEVKNSRTESKSRIWLAMMPTEGGRCAILIESTCSKMFEAMMTSSFLPVMSMMRLRTMRMTKSKIDRNAHADRQRDHRGHGAVRHHAVVDVHDEERARQREHVHDQRGDRDVAVVRPEPADDRPEPVRARQIVRRRPRAGRRWPRGAPGMRSQDIRHRARAAGAAVAARPCSGRPPSPSWCRGRSRAESVSSRRASRARRAGPAPGSPRACAVRPYLRGRPLRRRARTAAAAVGRRGRAGRPSGLRG